MNLTISLLPPAVLRAALLDVVDVTSHAAVRRPAPPAPEPVLVPAAPRRLLRRAAPRLETPPASPPPPAPAPPRWVPVDDSQLHARVTHLGNVGALDLQRLETTLATVVADVPALRITLSRPYLAGTEVRVDLDAGERRHELEDLAVALVRGVERLGFYCDRRAFQPWLVLARATSPASAGRGLPDLAGRLATLDGNAAATWVLDAATLARSRADGPPGGIAELTRVLLAAPPPAAGRHCADGANAVRR